MCFESPILQGTGTGLNMAGAGIFRYGKWEERYREAGGSDPSVPPSPTRLPSSARSNVLFTEYIIEPVPPPSVTSSGRPLCVMA